MQTAAEIEIGQVIRRIRFILGEQRRRPVSQGEFGAMVGKAINREPFGQPAVSAWEQGHSSPDGPVLAAALKLVGAAIGRPVAYEELVARDSNLNLSIPSLLKAA